jgi:hypothetical protein
LVLVAGYCALWVVSSSSLACVECNCSYGLLASNPRCRQPPLAAMLALGSLVLAIVAVVVGVRVRR